MKFVDADTKIVVVGVGYVGLVTGACLAKLGHDVVCVDISADRIDAIMSGRAPFFEEDLDDIIQDMVRCGRLRGTTYLADALIDADISIIAVGTPDKNGNIDLSQIETAGRDVGVNLHLTKPNHTVVLKSTCVPGTCDTVLRAAIESTSSRTSEEFGLAMNPEFLREGNAVFDFLHPDRIVMGCHNAQAETHMRALYASFNCPKLVTTPKNAEMIKYTSNALLSTMISFSNEISGICEAVEGLDEQTVMSGLHLDKRLSPIIDNQRVVPGILTYLRAGIGYGGSCLPKDTLALRRFAQSVGASTHMLDATITTNDERTQQIVSLLERTIGPIQGCRIAVLGLAFKPGTDDTRNSPGISLSQELVKRGADVQSWDPLVRDVPGNDFPVSSDILQALRDAKIAVIATAWPQLITFDWTTGCEVMASPVIFDGRSIIAPSILPKNCHLLTIGKAPSNA